MYLETRDVGEMMGIYSAAWERGVKTTYYLHMKPRHTAEQSTVKVNKSEEIGGGIGGGAKKGFGFGGGGSSTAPVPETVAAGAVAEAAPAPVARKGFGFGSTGGN
jgi:ribonucleoside-diphosphate reductase alpha chain